MKTAYCPTCRTRYLVDDNPPYAVVHTVAGLHLHPITREVLIPSPEHDTEPATDVETSLTIKTLIEGILNRMREDIAAEAELKLDPSS